MRPKSPAPKKLFFDCSRQKVLTCAPDCRIAQVDTGQHPKFAKLSQTHRFLGDIDKRPQNSVSQRFAVFPGGIGCYAQNSIENTLLEKSLHTNACAAIP